MRLQMAKADQKDLEQCFKLFRLFDNVESGCLPTEKFVEEAKQDEDEDGDAWPTRFDPEKMEHLELFHRLAMQAYSKISSAFMRVVFGFQTIVDNDILDPKKDHLELNPALFEDEKILIEAGKKAVEAMTMFGVLATTPERMKAENEAIENLKAAIAKAEGQLEQGIWRVSTRFSSWAT